MIRYLFCILWLSAASVFGNEPILIAHRGLLQHAPENTLPAFASCLELGIGIELDIRTTQDGVLVVIHDDDVKRTTDGPARLIREMTMNEVRELDAGSWFGEAFSGVRVPTLKETLELVSQRKRDSTIIALNVKDLTFEGESKLVALVEKYDLLDQAFAFDQSDEVSRRLKEINPAFRIGQNVNRADIGARLSEGILDCFLLTSVPEANEVDHLHSHKKQVLFNYAGVGKSRRDPDVWHRAALAGVDGMLTDYPLECRSVWRVARRSGSDSPLIDPRGVWVETPWGRPVIDRGAGGTWDHMAVDNPYVYSQAGKLYCFYEAQDRPFADGGREAFGIATSRDGITWEKLTDNPILSTGGEGAWDEVVAKLPAGVIKYQSRYHLLYSGRNSQTKQIGLATAEAITGPWIKSDHNPVLTGRVGEWDNVLSTHPSPLFEIQGRYHLLFRGMERRYFRQGLGVAVSKDLIHWERLSPHPVIPVEEEIASLALARDEKGFVAISQPMDLEKRAYWMSDDLQSWTKGPPVRFKASIAAETLSNPFLCGGRWTVLYEQQDRIYRAVLQTPDL